MDNTKTFRVSLDMKAPTAQRNEWEVVEGDNGNIIEITLTDDGEPVDLSGCKVLAVFGLPTGVTVEQDTDEGSVTIGGDDNNIITIALKTGSFSPGKSSSGLMKCEIQVYSGVPQNTLITSAQFTFRCRRAIMNDDTIAATDEYPVLVELIEEVQQLIIDNQSDWAEADLTDPAFIKNKPGAASTSVAGLVQLYNGVDSSSATLAATAAAVKTAYDKSVQFYKSVTELGLTEGSATIAGIWNAMSDKSLLMVNASQLASGERPPFGTYGDIEIFRFWNSLGRILSFGKLTTDGDYRMFLTSNNVPDGTWIRIGGENTANFTRNGNYTTAENNAIKFRKIGTVVTMYGSIYPTFQVPTYTSVGTIPNGFRPADDISLLFIPSTQPATPYWIYAGTDGECATQSVALPPNERYYVTATYISN